MKKNNTDIVVTKKSLKRRIVTAIIVITVVMVLLFTAVWVLSIISESLDGEEEYNFNFYEADYDENIFEDPEYIALVENGYISFCNMDSVTFTLDEEDAASYGADVEFMVDYIKYMINGDVKNYNLCYSDLYHEKTKPKENFTMQKIYDVTLKKMSEESVSDGGEVYTRYIFSLNYKILKNNGTLRNDFLNGSRTQYISLTNRTGHLKIDGVTVLKTAVK